MYDKECNDKAGKDSTAQSGGEDMRIRAHEWSMNGVSERLSEMNTIEMCQKGIIDMNVMQLT